VPTLKAGQAINKDLLSLSLSLSLSRHVLHFLGLFNNWHENNVNLNFIVNLDFIVTLHEKM
jgi:hypothetical protein